MITRRDFQGLAVAALCGLPGCARAGEPPSRDIFGTWAGRLEMGPNTFRLRLVITDEKSAQIISVDQNNATFPARDIRLSGTSLEMAFPSIQAKLEGRLTGKDRIEGHFTQKGKWPLVLTRGEAIAAAPAPAELTQDRLATLRKAAGTPALIAGFAGISSKPVILCEGVRALGSDRAATINDLWHWGSITKSMTATVAARLVERRLVDWKTTIGDVLGTRGKIREDYKAASLLHLLSHRAGLKPGLNPLITVTAYSRDSLPDPRAERLKYALSALDQKPDARLGETMIYSNSGYIVAGTMLEAITGKSCEDLIRDELYLPLGLKSAGFGPPGVPGKIDQPLGHTLAMGVRRPAHLTPGAIADNPVVFGPAGRSHMSLSDMLSYLAAHRDRSEAYLKRETWDWLHRPHFGGGYALGWLVRDDGTLWHNGSNTLWYANVMFNRTNWAIAAVAANDASPETQHAVDAAFAAAYATALKAT